MMPSGKCLKGVGFVLLALTVLSALTWLGCSEGPDSMTGPAPTAGKSALALPDRSDVTAVMAVQERSTGSLLAIDGVIGTGTGMGPDGRLVVKVYTSRPPVADIPDELEGIPVSVETIGEIHALGKPQNPGGGKTRSPSGKDWWPRPVPIGVSVGNANECSAGTIGCAVEKDGVRYILSNNHVLARENKAGMDEVIVQPGVYDRGCVSVQGDEIGTLADYVPISFGPTGVNYVDAAIAQSSPGSLCCATYTADYGFPSPQTVGPALSMQVKKVGRTTGLTSGTVTGVNVIMQVAYRSGTAVFVNQILISGRRFLDAGDSGSLVVTRNGANPVGLLFAGNSNGSTGIANPIDAVLGSFGVTICGE